MAGVSWTRRAGLDATVRAGTKATFTNETSVPTSRAKTGRARTDIASVYPGRVSARLYTRTLTVRER